MEKVNPENIGSQKSVKSISSIFIHAISYTFLASTIARLCGIVVSVLIARFLGSSELGLYAIVQSTLGLYATFLGLGLNLSAAKLVAEHYTKEPERTGRIIGLLLLTLGASLFIGVIIYFSSLPFLVNRIYKVACLLEPLKLALPWLIIMCVNQLLESVLLGLQGFKFLMITSSTFSILSLPITLTALLLGGANTLSALILAGTMASLAQLLLLASGIFFEAKRYKIILSFINLSPLVRSVLLDFSVPAFLGKLFEQPLNWLSILLLVKLGGDTSYVGGLTIINVIRSWILYFPNLLVSVLIPILTNIYHTRDMKDFQRTLVLNLRFLWISTLPFIVFILTIIRPVIKIFFGKSYETFWLSGAIFLLWTILIPVNQVNDNVMAAMSKMWLSLCFRIGYLIIFIVGLFLLIPKFNLNGYVIAGGIAYFVYVTIQTIWTKRIANENLNSNLTLPVFSFIFLAISFSISFLASAITALLCGLIVLIVVLVIEWFWLISAEEKSLIYTQLEKLQRYKK